MSNAAAKVETPQPNPTPCARKPGALPSQELLCRFRPECLDRMDAAGAKSFTCGGCGAYERLSREAEQDEIQGLARLGSTLFAFEPECRRCQARPGEPCFTASGGLKQPCPGRVCRVPIRWPSWGA